MTTPTPYATSERGDIWIRVCGLPDMECGVIRCVLDRLEMGLKQYGPWPRYDMRDMNRMSEEEMLDLMIYRAYRMLRKEIDAADLDDKRGCEGCP